MPCYFFTYHGKGTWLPDHRRGYVKRNKGIQPSDPDLAVRYRASMSEPAIAFTPGMRRVMLDAVRNAGEHIAAVVRGIGMDPTHIHILISWKHARTWKSIRASLSSAMSRALNAEFGKRDWFVKSPSRKRVRDHDHLDYLLLAYLPKHKAGLWRREEDVMAAKKRDALRPVSVRNRAKRRE